MDSPAHSWHPRRFIVLGVCLFTAFFLPTATRAFDPEAVKPSVPRILLLLGNKSESGSGFIVHSETDYSIVATNFHVIADYTDSAQLYVLRKVPSGIEAHRAEIIQKDRDKDLALLKVPGLSGQPLTLLTAEPGQAEDVYSIGYPGVADDRETRMAVKKLLAGNRDGVLPDDQGLASTYLEASVSKGAVRRVVSARWSHVGSSLSLRIIQHDVNIGHGNSGGPLFNASGQVIGVNTASRIAGSAMDVDKFSESSHIGALIENLKRENISFLVSDVAAKAREPSIGTVTVNAGTMRAGGTPTYLLIVVAGIAGFALFVAIRKRETLVESYSHFARRKAAALESAPLKQGDEESSVLTSPRGALNVRHAPAAAEGTCALEGRDPEDRKPIRVAVDEELWKKNGDRVLVGRSTSQAHLCIRNKSVSGVHLSLLRRDSQFLIEDRDSSNGTSINGRKLVPFAPVPVENGDLLQVGDVILRFKTGADAR